MAEVALACALGAALGGWLTAHLAWRHAREAWRREMEEHRITLAAWEQGHDALRDTVRAAKERQASEEEMYDRLLGLLDEDDPRASSR